MQTHGRESRQTSMGWHSPGSDHPAFFDFNFQSPRISQRPLA